MNSKSKALFLLVFALLLGLITAKSSYAAYCSTPNFQFCAFGESANYWACGIFTSGDQCGGCAIYHGCICYGDSAYSCNLGNFICQSSYYGGCPSVSGYEGNVCLLADESTGGNPSDKCQQEMEGRWDPDELMCVVCDFSTHTQYQKIAGTSQKCYACTGDETWTPLGCANSISKTCEAACGAASVCDEKSPNTDITHCGCGASYLRDKCDSNCGCVDSNVCGSSAFASDCTASSSCNGYAPGTTFPDTCGLLSLIVNKKCDSTCTYTKTVYTCDSNTHTNCQQQSCGGITYYCTYDGSSWQWRTSYPSEVCNDGVDNDCDGKTDCNDENCQITITSSPGTGSGFVTVDGSDITTPQTYCAKDSWAKGTTHTLKANSPVKPQPALQYVYLSWSDGGAQEHTITVPSSLPATYTANYKTQVYLSVVANPSAGGTVSGSGWYDVGTTATISATANTCYKFSSWTGSGTGSYTGTANPASVTMNSAITETANFGYDDGASCSGTPYCSGTNRCGGSEGDTRYYDFKCQSGSCAATSSENCKCDAYDSDGGQSYTTYGYCTDYTGCSGGSCQSTTYYDSCSGDTLTEYYVSGSGDSATCASTTYNCKNLGSDYICSGGRCTNCKKDGEACSSTSDCCSYYTSGTTCYYSPNCVSSGAVAPLNQPVLSFSDSFINKISFGIIGQPICEFSTCSIADSCTANTLTVGKTCSASGCSSGTSYTCNSNTHTNCQAISCGGSTYYCTYDGSSWQWRTSYPSEVCNDGVDNDCDGKTDCSDSDCSSNPSCPSGQPDLIIEDIWSSGSTIYYRIKNQGNANAGASTSRLTIDGSNVATDSVGNLAAGASSDRSFSYSWTCSGANDTVTVCADVNNAVSESDETNNCRTETWNCADTTPPTCSIINITESSAYAYSSGTSVWYNTLSTGSFTVNVAASDNVGVANVSFPATVSAGGSDTSSPYSWTYNWDTADTYSGSATVTAYDAAGNTGTCSFNVVRDVTAPTTTASVAGSYTITLSSTDNPGGSGCDKTYYCIDTTNTCNPTTQYTGGISTSCASCCYVRYYSVDRVSNQEQPTKSTQFGPTCGCVKANPSVSISPSSQSGSPGQTLTYTVNVTNNDNAACGSSIFSLTVTQCPSGFTCGLSKTSVTISPGSTDSSTTISVTSPSTATVGNYTFKVRATNNTYSGEAFANYSIPCTCTGWSSIGCGISPCASDQMKQSRSCSPSGCDIEEQCVADPLCTACNSNGVCDVAGPDMGETQINCPNDCYTRAKIIPWENLLPGAEVKVVVYFNDSRWYDSRYKSPGRDASLNLTIDGREWIECVVHKKKWENDIGWPGNTDTWSTVYQGKSVVITSTLGYAKLEANCSLPMWLGSGSHQFVAIPTIYSEPTVLAPATARFTVVTPSPTPPVSKLDIFLQFLKSLLLIKIF